jgi:type 1 glutamine amidotransferase
MHRPREDHNTLVAVEGRAEIRARNIRGLIGFLAIDAFFATAGAFVVPNTDLSTSEAVVRFIFILLGFPLALFAAFIGLWILMILPITFHEMGHVVAGKLLGFSFVRMQVGCLSVQNVKGNLRVRRSGPIMACNGHASMWPKRENWILRWRIYALGGPVASVVFLLFVLWLDLRLSVSFRWIVKPGESGINFVNLLLCPLTSWAALVLGGSIIPMRVRGHYTDAAVVLLSLTNSKYCEAHALIDQVGIQFASGIRAREWAEPDVAALLALEGLGPPLSMNRALILYYSYLDRRLFSEASAVLEPEINRIRGVQPAAYLLEQTLCYEAGFIAALNGNRDKVEDLLLVGDRFGNPRTPTRTRAEAALAAAYGDRETAAAKVKLYGAQVASVQDVSLDNVKAQLEWAEWALEKGIISTVKKALIIWGGWDGHEPKQVGEVFEKLLKEEGFEVQVSDTLDTLTQVELSAVSLFVPVWTMGEISYEQVTAVAKAAEKGMGIAGCHGGMCDSFRNSAEWQFITGGQWVAHPGDDGIEYTVRITDHTDAITQGIDDFQVKSEQYYMHTDPSNKVLAVTHFPVAPGPHTPNGEFDMPVVWTRMYGEGRVFYNSLGHHADVLIGPALEIMRRGFLWAAR